MSFCPLVFLWDIKNILQNEEKLTDSSPQDCKSPHILYLDNSAKRTQCLRNLLMTTSKSPVRNLSDRELSSKSRQSDKTKSRDSSAVPDVDVTEDSINLHQWRISARVKSRSSSKENSVKHVVYTPEKTEQSDTFIALANDKRNETYNSASENQNKLPIKSKRITDQKTKALQRRMKVMKLFQRKAHIIIFCYRCVRDVSLK